MVVVATMMWRWPRRVNPKRGLSFMTRPQVDSAYVAAAWVFVAFRALHSAVHCTFNLVMLRFYLYLIATLAVWFMVGRAAITYFGD